MREEYVITNKELYENEGINLEEYCADSTYIMSVKKKALNIAVTRICKLCDNINDELDIEDALERNERKVPVFKKLQGAIIYNLIFTAESSPTDGYIDDIIAHELNIGKVNNIQIGIHTKG